MSGGWKGSSKTNRREELPEDWEQLRKAQFIRDGGRCTYVLPSGTRCPNTANQADHVGDKWDHANLTSLCELHHGKKTAQQGVAGKAAMMAYRRAPRRGKEQHPGAL